MALGSLINLVVISGIFSKKDDDLDILPPPLPFPEIGKESGKAKEAKDIREQKEKQEQKEIELKGKEDEKKRKQEEKELTIKQVKLIKSDRN